MRAGLRQRSIHDKRLDPAVNACQVFADHHLADVLTALAPSSLRPISDCQTSPPRRFSDVVAGRRSQPASTCAPAQYRTPLVVLCNNDVDGIDRHYRLVMGTGTRFEIWEAQLAAMAFDLSGVSRRLSAPSLRILVLPTNVHG